ncbi:hypothetical protein EV702DRAFT_1049304 [Suillus placidus]|uniref:Uncharacterized protein n=1 Tax=Suillus placidus TaxID=48579 RepID=A0A9P6ZKZ6_9AGAM|nr:hypothetical protein EV702DRAFT_1049304 [Suillus placidus]
MGANLRSRCKINTVHTKHFKPYSRPSQRVKPSDKSTMAPLARNLAMYFDESEAQEATLTAPNDVWMGSAMSIDSPSDHSGVGPSKFMQDMKIDVVASKVDTSKAGVAHGDVAGNQTIEHLSPRERKLVCRLKNATNKCIERHCEMGHPTTDMLRKRIDTALQAALVGIMVEDIMLSCDLKGASSAKTGDNVKQQNRISTIDDYLIPPTVAHVFSSMKRGLAYLGTALSTKSEASGMHRAGTPPHMPGEYPIVYEIGKQKRDITYKHELGVPAGWATRERKGSDVHSKPS